MVSRRIDVSWRHDPCFLQTQKKVHGAGYRGGQTRWRQRRLSHRGGYYASHGQARGGDCQRGQSCQNFGIQHQARGVGNAQIRFKRIWPVPARLCSLFHARALRDVCGRLRVVENRRGRLRRFSGRHCRLRPEARQRILQMASVSYPLQVRLREGQSPDSGYGRFSAKGL
jgi:hypothetical protein